MYVKTKSRGRACVCKVLVINTSNIGLLCYLSLARSPMGHLCKTTIISYMQAKLIGNALALFMCMWHPSSYTYIIITDKNSKSCLDNQESSFWGGGGACQTVEGIFIVHLQVQALFFIIHSDHEQCCMPSLVCFHPFLSMNDDILIGNIDIQPSVGTIIVLYMHASQA